MLIRTRPMAGVLTLTALLLALAEGAWAATCICMPSMAAGSSAAMEMTGQDMAMTGMAAMTGMPAEMDADASSGAPDHHCMGHMFASAASDDGGEPLNCPFAPITVATCVALSFPAPAMLGIASSPEDAVPLPFVSALHETLIDRPLFHPPRA